MTRRLPTWIRLWTCPLMLLGTLGLLGAGPLAAQDPFGDDPFAVPDPVEQPQADVEDPAEPDRPVVRDEDPAVLAIVESDPSTPERLVWAAEALLNLGRPEFAKQYLQQVLAAELDQQALGELHRRFGGALFLRLTRDQRLAPEGAQVGREVLEAAHRTASDPDHLRRLVGQLNDPDPAVRRAAIAGLRHAETAAVKVLVQTLADGDRADQHGPAREALVALGPVAVEPLLGALESPDDALGSQVTEVLGRLRARQAIPYLVRGAQAGSEERRRAAQRALLQIGGNLAGPEDAQRYLYGRARAYFEGKLPGRMDHQDRIELWRWDAEQQASVPGLYPAADASLVVAARLAADLFALAPDNPDYRRLYLIATLSSIKRVSGLERPFPELETTARTLAEAVGVAALEDALVEAQRSGHIAGAMGAAEVLGEIAEPRLLHSSGGRPRPLVQALRHGDRRLRVAAAQAILKIDPQQPYAGSSYLTETLGFLAATQGTRRALVAHPRVEQARTMAGLLNQLGYDTDVASTGREAFQQVVAQPDYELLLVSDALGSPVAAELIVMLRRDPASARLPIGLIPSPYHAARAQRLAEADPLVLSVPQPHSFEGASSAVNQLRELLGRNLVQPQERLRHAALALEGLARLGQPETPYSGFYNLQRQEQQVTEALYLPALSATAAGVLGQLATAQAQRALADFASQNGLPLGDRQAAAEAFAQAIGRRGLLLTSQEILQQYDRYNDSASLDESTQQLLGSLLDAIEAPTREEGT